MATTVTTYSLQMTDPSQLRPSRHDGTGVDLERVGVLMPEYNRFFYTAIGCDWYWIDRLSWDYVRWVQWLDRSEIETWVAYVQGAPAGYYELEQQADKSVEIAYFGLMNQFIGQGLGGYLLSNAIRCAWQMPDAKRVWVHTCTLDHPNALAAYKARGLQIYREETHEQELPKQPVGPWPNANRP